MNALETHYRDKCRKNSPSIKLTSQGTRRRYRFEFCFARIEMVLRKIYGGTLLSLHLVSKFLRFCKILKIYDIVFSVRF